MYTKQIINNLMNKLDIAIETFFFTNIFLIVHFKAMEFNVPTINPTNIKKILFISKNIIMHII